MMFPPEVSSALQATIDRQPYPLLFVCVSGAHLYGFPSPDSDFDLRGAHILPPRELLGLDHGPATIEEMDRGEPEIDLVTHDIEKFFRMLLKPNGYVLEQLYSPIVLVSPPEHEELKTIAHGCITRMHVHHYRGFAENQWKLFEKEDPPRVKPLLYVFRVLLTGIHLMKTGGIEANLVTLNQEARLSFINELLERKMTGERATIEAGEVGKYRADYEALLGDLESAFSQSSLPEKPSARGALHDLLLRLRLSGS